LDTPLLTYRDPIKSPLAADEQELSNSSLKEFFFEHLSQVSDQGQIIVAENVDLPANIRDLAHEVMLLLLGRKPGGFYPFFRFGHNRPCITALAVARFSSES
jgi:hypothetical protein